MTSLFSKNYYNTEYCASWHICRNTLENPGFDNQAIVFFSYARHVFTRHGEEVIAINPGRIWKVLCITAGNAQFLFGQTAVDVGKNDIVIVGPDDMLRARVTHESKLKICHLGITDTPVIRLLLSRMHRERKLHLKEPDEINPYLRAIEDCLERNLTAAGRMCLKDLSVNIFALLSEIARQCLDFESRLSVPDIRTELSHNPESNYDISEVARKCGLSVRSFERQFKALTGCSFLLYLTGNRIGYACRLLKTTKYSVQDIVTICNFRSISYFYKVFRKHTGVTPCVFRGEKTLRYNSELSHLLMQTVQNTAGLTSNRRNMLWQILQNPRVTISDMAARLSIQRSAVQKNIEWLKNNGFITHRGSRRNGYWSLQAEPKKNWNPDDEKKER